MRRTPGWVKAAWVLVAPLVACSGRAGDSAGDAGGDAACVPGSTRCARQPSGSDQPQICDGAGTWQIPGYYPTGFECTGPVPICNPATGTCVQCVTDAQCSGTTQSSFYTNTAVSTPFCDTETGQCAQCLSDAQCQRPTPYCGAGTCQPCLPSSCAGATPYCNGSTGACEPCTSTPQCAVSSSNHTLVCDAATGTCMPCTSSAECENPAPVCDAASGQCAPCTHDADCGGATPLCLIGGACGRCSGAYCGTGAGSTICSATTGACGPCTSDAECQGIAPICMVAGACVCDSSTGRCGFGSMSGFDGGVIHAGDGGSGDSGD